MFMVIFLGAVNLKDTLFFGHGFVAMVWSSDFTNKLIYRLGALGAPKVQLVIFGHSTSCL